VRLPFIDTPDKAFQTVRQINHTAVVDGKQADRVHDAGEHGSPARFIQDGCQGMLLDMFGTFVHPLEEPNCSIKSQPSCRSL
jgi:hypothetical protein